MMFIKSNSLWRMSLISILTIGLFISFNISTAYSSETKKELTTAKTSDFVKKAMEDRVMGKKDAPVTIIEYGSLTCPHCANFTKEIFPSVKEKLIDTGKAKFIFRDFPLDKFALKAAMMARCVASDKYFNMIEVIFNNQTRWATAKDPIKALSQLASLAGMNGKDFKACVSNKELENAILKNMQAAQKKYSLKATPSFLFNGGNLMTGAKKTTDFEMIVNAVTKKMGE